MSRRRRSSILVCVLALIGGAILWWWHTRDRPIVFVMESADHHSTDLMVMAVDGTGLTPLTTDDEAKLDPAWSPDGQHLAFASGDIFVIQADGTQRRQLTNRSITGLRYDEPMWSPDGTRIAFIAAATVDDLQAPAAIYVMNADGANPIRLTSGIDSVDSPSWSADSRSLAFMVEHDEQTDIAILHLADQRYHNITNTRRIDEYRPRWSPDGQWIMFTANVRGTHDIHIAVIQPDGTGQTQLTHTASEDSDPSWSPDGSQIVFVSDRDFDPRAAARSRSFVPSRICQWLPGLCDSGERGGEYPDGSAIYVMNADGSNVRRLTDSVGKKMQPNWRPARR